MARLSVPAGHQFFEPRGAGAIRIANDSSQDIYVTIEDAAEVNARERAAAAADLQRLRQQMISMGALPPGAIVPVPQRAMTAEQVMREADEQRLAERAWAQGLLQALEPQPPNLAIDDILRWLRQVNAPPTPFTPEAVARAKELLYSHCNAEQREMWERYQMMEVRASTGEKYMLHPNGSVERFRDHHEFCLKIVGEECPREDAVLMRKLLIETNEPEFLRLANDLSDRRVLEQARNEAEMRQQQEIMERIAREATRARARGRFIEDRPDQGSWREYWNDIRSRLGR